MTLDTTAPLLSQPTRRPARRIVSKLLRLLVAAAVLAYLFHRVSPSRVFDAVASARFMPLLAAFVIALASQLTAAARLKRLADVHDLRLSFLEVLEINLATLFYGLFLPAGNFTGIAVRFYRMSKPEKAYAGTVVSLFLDRVAATIAICVVGITFWLVDLPTRAWGILVLMFTALAALLAAQAMLFMELQLPMLIDLQRLLGRWFPKTLETVRQAIHQARVLPRGLLVHVFAISVLVQLLGVLAYSLVAQSLGLQISFVTIGWVRSAAILVAILPVSIAGLGVREGTLVLLLVPYGIAASDTLAFSLLVFAATNLAMALLGGLFEARRLLLWRTKPEGRTLA